MTTLDILISIVGELNDRCGNDSGATGTFIRPFTVTTDGDEVGVNFMDKLVLGDDEINDGNDPDAERWRKIIEDEAINYLLAIRTLTIRDDSMDTGRCTGK